MITKEAIVLAGGLGTRLQGILPDIPKCMAPIQGKPFLAYVFDYLISQKINKVILSVGYLNDQIIRYFGNNYQSLLIVYSIEEEPLGTGGAIKSAINYCSQDQVFVINGDTYFIPDFEAIETKHIQTKADITIAVKYLTETDRYGLVQINKDGRITDFREKETLSSGGWINGGIYLIKKLVFDDFHEDKFSLENDVFKVSCSQINLQAFKTDTFFLDMGIPEDYANAQNMFTNPENI